MTTHTDTPCNWAMAALKNHLTSKAKLIVLVEDIETSIEPEKEKKDREREKKTHPCIGLKETGLPTCTDFRGTYRFWPSITISRFHAVVYGFWKIREFLGLTDFVLFCFRRYSRILPAFCTYRQSRRCAVAINRKVNETYLEVEVCLTFYRPRAPTKVK